MKRLIKFRGKDLNGQWAYGSLIKFDIGYVILTNEKTETNSKLGVENCIVFSENEIAVVVARTIGQFTGLLDKDGKEIYEGDVLKTPLGFIGKIVFGCKQYIVSHREFGRKVTDGFTCNGWIFERRDGHAESVDDELLCGEIIGNTFDTPELLKGGEE